MTNYGHPLRFGVELSAAANRVGEVIDLAVRAERLGADLVVFTERADDPVDAWTMAGWTAGRTSRVQIAATQTWAAGESSDRRPASTAGRAAASLQLLSGDRALLVFAATEAEQELPAFAEALAVIAALQDGSRPSVSSPGVHHRVEGAAPGPVLEQAVPIWLNGSDPVLVRLAGQVADGWVVDLDQVGVTGLAELNDVLDRAAVEAGRDPREVRRTVTVGARAARDVEGLVDLVVAQGVGGLLLRLDDEGDDVAAGPDAGTDDTALLTMFLTDIAPAVRAGAERALPPGALAERRPRRADVRARRRPGIAYDEVPEDLVEGAVEPGDPAYAKVRSTYLRGGAPGLVLRPRTVSEVASALAYARTHRHLALGIRSGGHGISGRSTNDGGLVIDVGALRDITVLDEAQRLVRIGAGARWRDVATALQPHGWALSSGDYGGVGVGGLATTGGIGFLNRKHGLTIDHLRAVELVLADGSLVRASEAENQELFWAMRGAGANFGIAVAFEFVVDEVDQVGWAQLAFQAADAAVYLEAFGKVAADTPRETTPFLILGQGMAQIMAMVDSNDPDVIIAQLEPFAQIAPLVQQQVVIAPYAAVMNMFPESPHNGQGEPVSRSALVREITPGFAAASADLIRSGASHWYQIRTVGGAVADLPADATAYAHRDANFSLTVMGANAQRLDRWFAPVRSHSDGLYLSFESDLHPDRLTEAFPPATLDRLRRLKGELDPHNLFQDNFNITPDLGTDTTRSA